MNAGKSTVLLQSSYNYQERGMETVVFAPEIDGRYGKGVIASRIGLKAEAILFDEAFNLYHHVCGALERSPNLKCVLLDEAQFLTRTQVHQLCQITDLLNLPVLAYGLRSDFLGEPFEGSLYLLALADILIEIKTICFCGRKATMNLRVDEQGMPVKEGAQVEIGGNDRYVSVCRKHFFEQLGGYESL